MDKLTSKICKPALVYAVIAIIVAIVGTMINYQNFSISGLLSHFVVIMVCTLLLVGICKINPKISWIITIIFVLLTILGIISTLLGIANKASQIV